MSATMKFQKKNPRAIISTRFGEMEIKFYPDNAPRHVENFLALAKMGFYDGLSFHRAQPGFMIQAAIRSARTRIAASTEREGLGTG